MIKIFFFLLLQNILTLQEPNSIIVTNHPICTEMASKIIKYGNIIDTAINIMLCEGIVAPQDSGIGGGFYGIFNLNNTVFLLNSRERTPKKIKFRHEINKKYCNIGVPSALKGYAYLHKNYGKLPWKRIVKPVIKICNKKYTFETYKLIKKLNMSQLLPYNRQLCKTLKQISIYGPEYFYTQTSKLIIKDLRKYNKYLTYGDFLSYKPIKSKASYTKYKKYKIYSTKYPATGTFIHKAFRDILENKNLLETIQNTYINISLDRYYKYFNKIQQTPILSNEHSTTNICLKKDKDYLCITSTINLYFGSRFYSKSTGVILNNQLDDIPIYYNKIPSKMIPPSSISTTIIKKNNKLDLILGGTGGSRIPAGIINVLYNFYVLNKSIKTSIYKKRYFYFNNILEIENYRNSYNTVTGLTRFTGSFDFRRGGSVLIKN
jgi:gamma-glutamyltranspeptidase / glutathione hydrolase / leukotriene-C4 hydrolase